MRIVSGSAHPQLATALAKALDVQLVPASLTTFANGEKRVKINDSLVGERVVVVQPFSHPADEHILEFLLIADALERMGAHQIFALIPWLGYSLQDKVFEAGEPIAAKVVANLVSGSHARRVWLLDVHNSSIAGFFSVPTTHLSAQELFVDYLRQHLQLDKIIVGSPDFGGLKRARLFANALDRPLINIDKHRDLNSGQVTAVSLNGEVSGQDVLLIDDCIVSGGTVIETSKLLKEQGAAHVYFCATHGVFAPGSIEKIDQADLDAIFITDSLPHAKLPKAAQVISSLPIFVKTLQPWR